MSKALAVGVVLVVLCAAPALPAGAPGADSPGRVIANPWELKWDADAKGSESATLREDPATGAVELFARYPAGHVFPPHWHSANERLILIEGRLSIQEGDRQRFLEPGGFAYLPAKQTQRMACVSSLRCAFYVYWDGKLDFNPAKN